MDGQQNALWLWVSSTFSFAPGKCSPGQKAMGEGCLSHKRGEESKNPGEESRPVSGIQEIRSGYSGYSSDVLKNVRRQVLHPYWVFSG